MQMKKIYSLLLAAGIAATATAAVAPRTFELSKDSQTYTPLATEQADLLANSSFRAPAMAAAELPQSLEGKKALVRFTLVEQDQTTGQDVEIPLSGVVTFSDEEIENGIKYYTMTSFLAGVFNSTITVHSVTAAYIPEENTFALFGGEPYLSAGGKDYTLWAGNATGNCVSATYTFSYTDGVFVFDNPFTVKFEGEDPEEFTAANFLLGVVSGQNLSVGVTLTTDLTIQLLDASGDMTYVMTNNQGAQDREAEVGVGVNGSTVTIYNFAGMGDDVPMEINTTDKTLTATNVQMTSITKYKAFLSEADADQENAAGTKKYVLKSTYDVANGKTTISVPDWNAFYYSFGADNAYFWPMSNTEINLDIDIEALANAGVEGIAADAEFDANAPVEYFNLQGIRVATPEGGQLLIKRQGKKVEKVVVR